MSDMSDSQDEPQNDSENLSFKDAFNLQIAHLTEKKNDLDYLSWSHAILLLKTAVDSNAYWEFLPQERQPDNTVLVKCVLYVHKIRYELQLAVMHHGRITGPNGRSYNGICAKENPSAKDISDTQMRCLTKLIAMASGVGLTLYSGDFAPIPKEEPYLNLSDTSAHTPQPRPIRPSYVPLPPITKVPPAPIDPPKPAVPPLSVSERLAACQTIDEVNAVRAGLVAKFAGDDEKQRRLDTLVLERLKELRELKEAAVSNDQPNGE